MADLDKEDRMSLGVTALISGAVCCFFYAIVFGWLAYGHWQYWERDLTAAGWMIFFFAIGSLACAVCSGSLLWLNQGRLLRSLGHLLRVSWTFTVTVALVFLLYWQWKSSR